MGHYQNISAVLATDEQGLIGDSDSKFGLPWHYPMDLQRFWNTIKNEEIVLGRKTFETLSRTERIDDVKYSPSRIHVLSHTDSFRKNSDLIHSEILWHINQKEITQYLYNKNNTEIIIAGGKTIYEMLWSKINCLYLTFIKKEHSGDVYLNKNIDIPEDWEIQKSDHPNEILEFLTLTKRV